MSREGFAGGRLNARGEGQCECVCGRCCRDGDVASGRSLFSARNDPFAHISDI